jgi:hypothetical protein
MNTKTHFTILVLAGATFASPHAVRAQAEPSAAQARDTLFFVGNAAPLMPFGGRVDVLRGEAALVGDVVKDKPYTADSVTETAQILADGNRITHRNEARFYRDSAGRTRREQTLSALGVWQAGVEPLTMITINDPVQEVSYFLDPVSETVRQFKPQRLAVEDGNGFWTRAVPAPGVPAPDGAVSMGVRIERDAAPGAESAAPFELPLPPPEAGIAVATTAAPVRAFPPGAVAFSAFGAGPVGETTKDDLGEQVLEGVLARGSRETQTIPAGMIGNEREIQVVAEEWYSKDIEAVVLRRTFDPRFGETSYRLVNLVRGEPSPDLFAVPQGYQVLATPQPYEIEHRLESGTPGERVERRVFVVQPEPQTAGK